MSVLITEASYFRVGLGGRTHQSDQCTHEIVALQNRFLKSCSCVFLELLTLRDPRRGQLEARSLEAGRPERRGEVTKMLVEELKR